jgi:hypothetical protein
MLEAANETTSPVTLARADRDERLCIVLWGERGQYS